MEKKRIYSGKKYKKQNYYGPNEWSYSYKYEGQKTFWARTDESPKDYEIRLKSEKITIKYKSEEYTIKQLWSIKEDIQQNHFNELENKEPLDDDKIKLKKEANRWKSSQRSLRRKGKLEQQKVDKLNKLGMLWNPLNSEWDKNFSKFKENGLNTDIEKWVYEQRKLYETGAIPKENLDRLKAFNFPLKKEKNEHFKISYSKIYELIDILNEKIKKFETEEREK